ncbi:hypothetical protein SAMN05660772_02347 [Pasteurella testudinis DSM 23072]|uniref:Uncharacterized protein n=1 Tax=Pasteurella testudinis DSM 23072 TaxID=1122938 RepID=A0A1W1UUT9_9PAST|nr:hypothetical protein [Pasteurella testudinis]SMB84796.1 hypothetical protein SAMN05660772_02347 [Pasteurella testudinis DSM 23072]SUB51266.1 Uncharacterised protein [Pasteurella testudinis]
MKKFIVVIFATILITALSYAVYSASLTYKFNETEGISTANTPDRRNYLPLYFETQRSYLITAEIPRLVVKN